MYPSRACAGRVFIPTKSLVTPDDPGQSISSGGISGSVPVHLLASQVYLLHVASLAKAKWLLLFSPPLLVALWSFDGAANCSPSKGCNGLHQSLWLARDRFGLIILGGISSFVFYIKLQLIPLLVTVVISLPLPALITRIEHFISNCWWRQWLHSPAQRWHRGWFIITCTIVGDGSDLAPSPGICTAIEYSLSPIVADGSGLAPSPGIWHHG